MSQAVVERLTAHFGERVLETSDAFGDHEVVVAIKDWAEVAQFMKDDSDLQMDHFIDLTAGVIEVRLAADDAFVGDWGAHSASHVC
ncbi:MAG: hypothetical protein JRI98_03145 [Deltaproteobacteria bacterium]|nr:hypothetical protein [Deltaproteobacteria bacterium]